MKTTHIALTLRGNSVENGIAVSDGQVPFSPGSGMTRHNTGLLASTPAPDGSLDKIHVAVVEEGVVLVSCEETPQKELVLVKQYSNGSGGKRWPSFHVEFGSEIRKLSEASTSGGSGGETWVLVSAPIGWAENIASQFVNERDYGGQTISYKPGNTGKKESDLPQELLIAFRGDEEMTRKFMDKVATLPSDRLDDHIVQSCGRARVKAHLEEISGDPDFFMGADPNRVAFYVATVHFSKVSLGKTQLVRSVVLSGTRSAKPVSANLSSRTTCPLRNSSMTKIPKGAFSFCKSAKEFAAPPKAGRQSSKFFKLTFLENFTAKRYD